MATSLIGIAILAPAAILATVFGLDAGSAPGHPFIKLSADVAMLGWFAGTVALLEKRPAAGRIWATGCAYFHLHVAIAFHLAHGWSHAEAFEQTRRTGGIGEGIFANYACALIWLTDALWLLLHASSYRRRPITVTALVHGFLFFMVVNAMVVFSSWPARALFGLFAAIAAIRWVKRYSGDGVPEPSPTGSRSTLDKWT